MTFSGDIFYVIRSFIAFELPRNVLERVSETQQRLKKVVDGVRWVRPGGIHLTLQFLGNIREESVTEIHAAMTSCATGFISMKVSLGKLGSFPQRGMPRVIWAGLEGDIDRLQVLKAELDEALIPLGFNPEKRPFKPHLTLGRNKKIKNPEQLRNALEKLTFADSTSFMLEKLILFKSELFPTGAVYTPLATVGLS